MKIVITTVQIPFIRGGAEIHAENLKKALIAHGHETELIAIPFKWYPPEKILDQMLACRLLDLTESDGQKIDLLIGLKFPAYLIPHPNKVIWMLHQHRPAYDLWTCSLGDLTIYPNGSIVREAIWKADRELIPEAKKIFTNSLNVSRRLENHCGIVSPPLYHPPLNAEKFYCEEPAAESYLFFPSRINPNKRQHLVLEAMALTGHNVRVLFASSAVHPKYFDEIKKLVAKYNLEQRVEWLGKVSEEEKLRLYARSLGVLYPPVDEDYGYVTLEAMLASKPVITCTDSGGPLEFVIPGKTGLECDPAPAAMARAMDSLYEDRTRAAAMGAAARDHYESLKISWANVVEKLVS